MGLREAQANEQNRKDYSVDEWYSCVRKKRYVESDAKGAARKLQRERPVSGFIFTAYECAYCSCWHVGRTAVLNTKRRRYIERDARAALATAIENYFAL